MASFFRDYGLSIVLAILFLFSWGLQAVFQWQEVQNEAMQHGDTATGGEFLVAFFSSTAENWQSEFLQLFVMVVLTAYLIHRGSAQSKDSQEEMQRSLNRIEKRLEELSRRRAR